MSQSRDRLKRLEEIEHEIMKVLQTAGQTLLELSKDSPSDEVVNTKATQFVKSLEGVEKGLSEQISYLTQVATGQPHEGSTYGVEKDFQLSCVRTAVVQERLKELRSIIQNHEASNSG
ncbi:mediator of RNA polymerase II transcription subunit 11-like [Actinia tenebrosa]|uniref:Mediator of RNA polymerase II transcription subunit 11 n=1 Tax=Actinia tenebrosa TaxID=6105 RepID=A0A6P8I401_ACTTE|nr:mediator of RNA polymerase II transcription subunit 11-like [Actinia tenebrosa]